MNGRDVKKRLLKSYLVSPNTLVAEIAAHPPYQLQLLFDGQAGNSHFHDAAKTGFIDGDERVVVHVSEEPHDELAIHAISHAAMARNRVAKVLDLEGALQAGREEAAERSDERGECCQDQGVELNRGHGQGEALIHVGREEEERRQAVGLEVENRVTGALEASEDVCGEILGRSVADHSGDAAIVYSQ